MLIKWCISDGNSTIQNAMPQSHIVQPGFTRARVAALYFSIKTRLKYLY